MIIKRILLVIAFTALHSWASWLIWPRPACRRTCYLGMPISIAEKFLFGGGAPGVGVPNSRQETRP
jgi:hypothetical protein